jgi:hypothetical protein
LGGGSGVITVASKRGAIAVGDAGKGARPLCSSARDEGRSLVSTGDSPPALLAPPRDPLPITRPGRPPFESAIFVGALSNSAFCSSMVGKKVCGLPAGETGPVSSGGLRSSGNQTCMSSARRRVLLTMPCCAMTASRSERSTSQLG